MSDWVHCNSCFLQPDGKKNFSLTNCGHIFCQNCIQQASSGKCPMCGASCSAILLSSQLKPEVEIFFTDPLTVIRNQNKQLLQIMEFQISHRKRLDKYKKGKNLQQASALQNIHQEMDQLHNLKRENLMLKEEIQYLKRMVEKYVSQPSPPGYMSSQNSQTPTSQSSGKSQSCTPTSLNNSPYSLPLRNKIPNSINLEVHHMSNKENQTIKPSRITVRTPPVNGRMGVVPGSPSPNLCASFGILRTSSGSAEQTQSPRLSSKPASDSLIGNATNSYSNYTPSDSYMSLSQPCLSSENRRWNPASRQIQITSSSRPCLLPLIRKPVQHLVPR